VAHKAIQMWLAHMDRSVKEKKWRV